MIQQRRNRGRILSDRGWDKLQDTLREKFKGQYTIEQLTELTVINPKSIKALSTDTVSKILRREEKVDKTSIDAFFIALGLKLEKDDITVNVQVSPPKLDPNFVGREGAIADLKNQIQQGAKAIVIHGKGGIGKTTLAWQFLHTQGFDKILDLRMAKETQNITSAESVIEEWLRRYFDEEPGREFGVTLDRLRQHLRNPSQRIGILIDNLEPALDQNGRCIEAHRKYVELFTALADPAVQSVTLITSRECLREAAVTVENYRLEGLAVTAWEEFFNSRNIHTDTEVLNAMHQAYGGNAKAMRIFPDPIKEYNNSLAAYWQANKDDLLIEPDLEHLVASQFNRLQQLDSSAYKLLCRLGCYRYQDVPRVPIEGLFCLLWNVPDSQHRRVVKSLQDKSLVDFFNQEYWLHPVIRAEAIKRLRESEDWETVNRKAAEFYYKFPGVVSNIILVKTAFEAIEHFYEIQDFDNCYQSLIIKALKGDEIENLRCSTNLWNNTTRIISIVEKIIKFLSPKQKAIILIPLGIIYTEDGENYKAIKVGEEISKNCQQDISDNQLNFAQVNAYLIIAKANRLIGKFKKSELACEKAIKIAKALRNSYWKGLALYERANLYLEIGEPRRAVYCFIVSAFQAVGSKIPKEVYQISKLIFDSREKIPSRIQNIVNRYDKNKTEDDRTKKLAILWNLAKCFNAMKLYSIAKIMIDYGLESVDEKDANFVCWFNLELANYYLGIESEAEAESCYKKAMKSSTKQGQVWCQVNALKSYGDWNYRKSQCDPNALKEAFKTYMKLDTVLEKTDFLFLKAHNCYQLALTYRKMGDTEKNQQNFQKAIQFFTDIEAPEQVEKVRQAMENKENN